MKIQNNAPQQPIVRTHAERAGKATDRSATDKTGASASSVQLSDAGRQLSGVRAPEVPDQARIEHLRGLLAAGKLNVDAHAIADAMLRDEK